MELRDLLDEAKVKGFQKQLKRKGFKSGLKKVTDLAKKHFEMIPQLDALRAERNLAAKNQDINRGKELSGQLDQVEAEFNINEKKLQKSSVEKLKINI